MRAWIAPWHIEHFCDRCEEGWVCENHPDRPWPSGCDCGAGQPCEGLLREMAQWETEARAVLGDPRDA
jgi:hypothetical protein